MAGLSLALLRQLSSSDLSQRDRLLRLATPLGQDALLVECVRGEESISHGFSFAISALSADANLPLKPLIGQPALLQLMTAHSRDVLRPFHGYLTAVEHSGADGGLARYRLTLEPWTRFASLGRDSRVFQNKTVFDIIDAVFREYQGKGRLAPAWRFDIVDRSVHPVRSLTTQYQESNFAFVERLMAEEGLFHFFEHTGQPHDGDRGSQFRVPAELPAAGALHAVQRGHAGRWPGPLARRTPPAGRRARTGQLGLPRAAATSRQRRRQRCSTGRPRHAGALCLHHARARPAPGRPAAGKRRGRGGGVRGRRHRPYLRAGHDLHAAWPGPAGRRR